MGVEYVISAGYGAGSVHGVGAGFGVGAVIILALIVITQPSSVFPHPN